MLREHLGYTGTSPDDTDAGVAVDRPKQTSKRPTIRTLEPRMVFDAAGDATAHQASASAHAEPAGGAGHASIAEPALAHLAEALKAAPVTPVDKSAVPTAVASVETRGTNVATAAKAGPAESSGSRNALDAGGEPTPEVASSTHVAPEWKSDQTSVADHAASDPRPGDARHTEVAVASDVTEVAPKAVFFIWNNVQDWQQIADKLGDTAQVYVLDSSKDGVAQMAALLKGESNISAIHLVSHGAEGNLNLGSAVLDAGSMQGRYLQDLTSIGQTLSEDGDILIYGCDFAAGSDGLQAAIILGGITRADIAASIDPTGSLTRGGDWDLERHAGTIETDAFADADYQYLLAAPTVDLDGTGGSTGNSTASYAENGSAVSIVASGLLGATVLDSDGDLQSITITADAAPSGDAEHLSLNGVAVGLDTDSTNTVVVGTTTYSISYTAATRIFTITNNSGGTIPSGGDTNALVRSITYDNGSDDPTNGGTNTSRVFSFTATDLASSTSAASTATVTITAANDAPVNTLPGSGWTTNEDTAVQLTGLQISDPDTGNGIMTVTLSVATGTINATTGGGVTIGGTGTDRTLSGTLTDINAYLASASAPTYTPVADANGDVTLTMTTTDNGNSGGAAIIDVDTGTITIDAVNDAPVGVNDSNTILEDATATGNVLTNDIDVDGNTLSVTQFLVGGTTYAAGQTATLAGVGTLVIGSDGSYTFTPVANYDGPVPVATYTVSDGSLTSTATLTLAITPVNDAPIDGNETNTVGEDTTLTVANGAAGDLLNNATDADGDALTITAFSVAGQGGPFVIGSAYTISGVGTITINSNGSYAFTPVSNYVGAIPVITYTVSDGASGTDTSTLTLTIMPANDAPVGTDNTVTINEDSTYTFSAASFGFTDPNDTPANTLQAVIITTLPSASEGTLLLSGVPVNAGQTITLAQIGNLTFQPAADVNGSGVGVFTFQVVDNGGTANGGEDTDQSRNTFTFNITPLNDAPVGTDDTATTPEETTLTVPAGSGLLSNDIDVDGDTLTITQFTVSGITATAGQSGVIPGVGTLTINADGSYSFTPVANFTGFLPVITYTVTDANGTTDTATLTIEVTPVNDPPVDGNETNTVTEDTTLTVPAGSGLLVNTSDLDGGTPSIIDFTVAGQAGPFVVGTGYLIAGVGTVTIGADGSYSFVPAANYDGAIPVITYTVSDGAGGTDSSTLTLTMTPVNDAPIGSDDGATTPANTPVSGNVLGNDTDVDDTTLTVTFFEFGGTTYGAGTTANIAGVGTLVINADGSYTFTPAPSYDGPVPTATYTLSDGTLTDTAVLTLVITPLNDPPVADDETGATPEDTTLNVPSTSGLLVGDTDVDGDTLVITGFEIDGTSYAAGDTATIPGVGALTINADGSYVFVPAANYNGPVPVATYTVSDGNGGTDEGTLTLTVTPVNDIPVTTDDTGSTPEDTTLGGDVLANDTDVDGDTLTIVGFSVAGIPGGYIAGSTATIPGVGTITVSADGTYVLVPAANYTGPVPVITYVVADGNGGTATGTITLQVTPINDPPIANDDNDTTAQDTTLNGDVLDNDTDVDGDTLTVTGFEVDGTTYAPGDTASIPGVGDLTLNADGTYTFVPEPGYNGPVPDVTYSVSDGNGGSDDGTLSIDIIPPNLVGANNDTATIPEDTTLTGNVLTNDVDPDGDPLSVVSFTVAGDATVYTAGTPATIVGVGTLTINADGSYTFVPAANYNGPVPIVTYTATDGSLSDTATLTITVTPVNDLPGAVNDTATTAEDTAVNGNVLSNDTDVDGNTLSVTGFVVLGINFASGQTATIPSVGQLTINANGTFSFVPDANYNGTVPVVTYTVSDGNGGVSTATLAITVTPVNDAPIAVDDTGTTSEDTTLTVSAPGLLSNDTDIEGASLSITGFTVAGIAGSFTAGSAALIPGVGTLTINANGSYTFVPASNFNGAVPLVTYTTSDGALSDTATLSITVSPVNDAPVATDDTATLAEDTTLTVPVVSGLLANDTDTEGSALSVTQFVVGGITYGAGTTATISGVGTLTINANGSYVFTPIANYNGVVPTVTYTVADGNGGTDTAILTITVTPVNDDPVANDNTGTTLEDTTLTGSTVIANDTDIDGDTLSVTQFTIAGDPTVYAAGDTAAITGIGTFTLNANGTYTFVPAANYNGPVPVVTYTASDGAGGLDTATLTIDITPVNDAPSAVNDTVSTNEDTTLTVAAPGLLLNDVDVDGDTLTIDRFTIAGISGGFLAGATTTITGVGTLTINANGSYTFVPVANYNGPVPVITYRVTDGVLTSTATLTITITPVNDAPVDGNETNTVTEDTTLTVSAGSGLLVNTTDIDGGTPTISAFTIAGQSGPFVIGTGYFIAGVGTLTINADGSYSFAPATNYAGAIPVITYTVSDNAGGTDTSTLTLTMVPVNDAPVDGNEARSVTEDTTLTVPAGTGLLANTTDVDGGTPSVSAFTIAGQAGPFVVGTAYVISGVGTLTINANGSYSFVPATNYAGAIPVVTYTVSDAAGGTDTSTLTLTMVPVNDAPVATDDTGTTPEDTTLNGNVLSNDTDVEGNTLSLTQFVVGGTTYSAGQTATIAGVGTLTINANGTYTFVPSANYNGPGPTATYTVSDGAGGADTATLAIAVAPVNDAPVDGNETRSVTEDTTLTVSAGGGLLANTTDIDGGTPSVAAFTVAGRTGPFVVGTGYVIAGVGTLTINADGSYSFAPVANYAGAIPVVTYTVSDGAGGTNSSTLTLTMIPVNDAPVDGNETNTVTEDTTRTVSVGSGLLANATDIDGGALSVTAFTVAGRSGPFVIGTGYVIAGIGTLTVNANGSYSFAPVANYTGVIPVVTYTVSDGAGGTDTSNLTLTMVPVNDAPVDGDEANIVIEDTTRTVSAGGGLLANSTDVDGGTPSVSGFTVAGRTGPFIVGTGYLITGVGTLTIRADGSYTFAPVANYTGAIPVVTYTVSDGAGGTDTSTLTLTMVPVNDPPIDGNEARSVTEDATLTIGAGSGLLANTTDIDGGTPRISAFTIAGQSGPFVVGTGYAIAGVGTLTINANGSYSFTPAANYTGAIPVVTYTVSDGAGGTDASTLTLTMVPVNDPPVASNDVRTTPEDTALNGNVLTNDTDIDGGALSVTRFVIGGTTYTAGQTATITDVGTLTINANGTYVFTPALNYNGPVPAATYTVSDGTGGTDTARLIITVRPVNDGPDPDEGDGTDTDGDGDGDGDGTDIPNQAGVDATTVSPVDVTGYFFDVDGDVLGYSASGLPAGLSIDPVTGVISGTLANDASQGGPYTVEVTATDPSGLSATQTFTWAVTNPDPTAHADVRIVAEDTTLNGNVLTNDRDPDGDPLTLTQFLVGGTTYNPGQIAVIADVGILTMRSNGSYRFVPALNYNGPVPVAIYTVSDGNGGVDTSRLVITVTPVNDPPGPDPNRSTIDPQKSIDGRPVVPVDASESFFDIDGDPLTYSAVGLPDGLSINPETGVIRGTLPNDASQHSPYIVVVTATDTDGLSSRQVFTWTVTNPVPNGHADVAVVAEDTTLNENVLSNDRDPDGDTLSVTQFVVDGTTYAADETATIAGLGALTMRADGSYTFIPVANYNGPVPEATYTLSDGNGGTDTARLIITVRAVNDGPDPDDGDGTDTDGNGDGTDIPDQAGIDDIPVSLVDVSGYFFDVDGDVLSYTASGLPVGLSIDPVTGIISGTLARDASQGGPYTIVVKATDPSGLSTTQTFDWTVTNPDPLARSDIATIAEDSTLTGTVVANDLDPDGDAISVAQFTVGGGTYAAGHTATIAGVGALIINADGSYTFTPAANYNGRVPLVTYTLLDSDGGSDTARLVITVTPVDDGPDIVDDEATGVEDTPITGNVLDNDSDLDGDTLAVTGFIIDGDSSVYLPGDTATIPGVGTISLSSNGDFVFMPEPDYFGPVPDVVYTASDGNGGTGEATLRLTVNPVDDFVPTPDDKDPILPIPPGEAYHPADVDGAVIEAVYEIHGLNDVAEFADHIEQPIRFGLRTFLGGTSTIIIDLPGDGDERLRIEVTKHTGIVYLQLIEQTEERGDHSGLRYEIRGKDGLSAAAWLQKVGPMTFAGYPDADSGAVELILSVINADGESVEEELRLDSITGNISSVPVPLKSGFNESFAPMFSAQFNEGGEGENLGALERALGFH